MFLLFAVHSRGHIKLRALRFFLNCVGFVKACELLFLAADSVVTRFNNLFALCVRQNCVNCPVFLGFKRFNFALAVNNKARCNRLHSSGAETLAHLFPEQRTYLIAHYSVKHTTRLLRVHKLYVNRARIFQRRRYRSLCYLVKGYAAFFVFVNSQNFRKVPADCFPLAVGVGCEKNLVRCFCRFFELCQKLALAADCYIFRLIIMLRVNTQTAFRKIAQMPHRSNNGIIFSKILVNCFCLCR